MEGQLELSCPLSYLVSQLKIYTTSDISLKIEQASRREQFVEEI